jgi:hypothetical protein
MEIATSFRAKRSKITRVLQAGFCSFWYCSLQFNYFTQRSSLTMKNIQAKDLIHQFIFNHGANFWSELNYSKPYGVRNKLIKPKKHWN